MKVARSKASHRSIQLKSTGRSVREVSTFRQAVLEKIGDRLFYINDKEEFLFTALNTISPVNKNLSRSPQSIEKTAKAVMDHFGFKSVKILRLGKPESKEPKVEKSFADKFLTQILHIEILPYEEYQTLKGFVDADLNQLNELISWYENETSIKKFIATGEIPKDSEERPKFDFYQRSLRERGEITNYLLVELKRKVLSKVSPFRKFLGAFAFHRSFDRPYKFAREDGQSYFDSRKIDHARHRLDEFYFDEIEGMARIYETNKAKFYRIYFRRIPPSKIFNSCFTHLSYLPTSKDRIPIFKELISLYKSKKWMAFYALGLPQVEGLFSEMCLAINPHANTGRSGLSQKVHSVRPHYNSYYDNLDYFQYHIPILRNRFAHTGYDEDFKLKAFDLLVDLLHLLVIFSELDNPFVKLKRLHSKRNAQDFSSVEQFDDYFKLIEELDTNRKVILAADFKDFESSFLLKETAILSFAQEIAQKLPIIIQKFISSIEDDFHSIAVPFEFQKTNQTQIKNLASLERPRYLLQQIFKYPNDHLAMLLEYHAFVNGFLKFTTGGPVELRQDLQNLSKKYSKNLIMIGWIVEESQNWLDDN